MKVVKKKLFLNWMHSEYCKNVSSPIIENLKDINKEVNNNNELRKVITNYLENHPLIEYNKYIIKAQKIYNKIIAFLKLIKILLKIYILIGKIKLMYILSYLCLIIIKQKILTLSERLCLYIFI